MELKLHRIFHNDKYTIGKLFINGVFFCDTIEDVERDIKIMNETCIPKRRYQVIVNMSNRFKRLLPLLIDVPEFEGIRIHNGKDQNSSSGCIIVGENKVKGRVINSTYYMNKLTDLLYTEQQKAIKSYIEIC